MKWILTAVLVAALTAMPALAQYAPGEPDAPACPEGMVQTPEGCSRQAWVDDCPPEMMCAAGCESCGETIPYGPGPADSGIAPGKIPGGAPASGEDAGNGAQGDARLAGHLLAGLALVAAAVAAKRWR